MLSVFAVLALTACAQTRHRRFTDVLSFVRERLGNFGICSMASGQMALRGSLLRCRQHAPARNTVTLACSLPIQRPPLGTRRTHALSVSLDCPAERAFCMRIEQRSATTLSTSTGDC